ncbi:MAG: AsnC family transcriptional regulator [Burkholderiales bacterium]
MDGLDRRIIDALQGGIAVCEHPFQVAAAMLGLTEGELLGRVSRLIDAGALTRFGPMYNADALGGAFTLAAMRVPPGDFERVAALVNAHSEVAHNYRREHDLNMWFVIATDRPGDIAGVIEDIERDSGYPVVDLPKLDEYFVGLHLTPL